MTDYADLIRQLHDAAKYLFERHKRGCESLGVTHDAELEECIEWKAADTIEALMKERDDRLTLHIEQIQIARKDSYSHGLRDGERIGLEKAAKVADAHWSKHRDPNCEEPLPHRAEQMTGAMYIASSIRALIKDPTNA